MKATYGDYILKEAAKILAVPSPSGYTEKAAKMIIKEFEALGCKAWQTVKGGVMVDFGGKNKKNAILLEAHMDTLGGMVAEVKGNGRLRLLPLGGMNANNAEAENCTVITKFNGEYEGTLQLCNASIHVNGDYNDIKREWGKMEVVLDEANSGIRVVVVLAKCIFLTLGYQASQEHGNAHPRLVVHELVRLDGIVGGVLQEMEIRPVIVAVFIYLP